MVMDDKWLTQHYDPSFLGYVALNKGLRCIKRSRHHKESREDIANTLRALLMYYCSPIVSY